jgi:hypothetical protein
LPCGSRKTFERRNQEGILKRTRRTGCGKLFSVQGHICSEAEEGTDMAKAVSGETP